MLFDLDGVLVDTKEIWFRVVNAVARELQVPPLSREKFEPAWGQGIQADIDTIFPGRTIPEIEAAYERHFAEHVSQVIVNPDAHPVLADLRRRGIRTAVITNTAAPLARKVLEAALLVPEVIVGGTDVPNAKPAPDMVVRACALLQVQPTEAIVVGDSPYDREAARAAKVRFIGYGLDGDERIDTLADLLRTV